MDNDFLNKKIGIMECCGAPLVMPIQHFSHCKYHKEEIEKTKKDFHSLLVDIIFSEEKEE